MLVTHRGTVSVIGEFMGETFAHKIPLQIMTEFKVDSQHTLNPQTLFFFLQFTPISVERDPHNGVLARHIDH